MARIFRTRSNVAVMPRAATASVSSVGALAEQLRRASSCCPPPKIGLSQRRQFAQKISDEDLKSFPDSWVEPETLMEFADAQEDEHPDVLLDAELGQRNQKWREQMLVDHPTAFDDMGAGQAPRFLWIGCCDSRVAPENMIGANPGEIFVHRNIANMVIATDTNLRAALLYAVNYLKVEHIVVCGHYDCGGVKAAMTKKDHQPPLENWLTSIRDVYRLHQEELEAILDFEERHKRLVELNVIEQCLNLFKTGDVQRSRTESLDAVIQDGRDVPPGTALPRIHAMVFSPNDGILRRLPVDFKEYMRKYRNVYNLYDSTDVFASYQSP